MTHIHIRNQEERVVESSSGLQLAGGRPESGVCTRADKTAEPRKAYLVRMRTIGWPQQAAFIAHLDRRKKEAGYRSDLALADAAGISHTSISNWRRGRQRPSMEALHGVAEALGEPDTAHSLAELAGLVDPERFGLPRAKVRHDEGEELILNSGASPAQIKMMLERYHRKLDSARRDAVEDVRDQIELLRHQEEG